MILEFKTTGVRVTVRNRPQKSDVEDPKARLPYLLLNPTDSEGLLLAFLPS